MNRILPAAFVLALSSGIALAQQAPAPIERQAPSQQADAQTVTQTPGDQMPGKRHHQQDPAKEAKHLSKTLNLTSDQQAKLAPILADRQQKMQALMANTDLDPKSRHQQMRAIRTSTEQQLATFLTPDQLQQLKSMRQGGGHHGRKGGTEPLNPAPAA